MTKQRSPRYHTYPALAEKPIHVEPPFACYVLCYPWGEPFYVGAGFRSRITDWLTLKGRCANANAGHVIRSLRERSMDVDVFIALVSDSRHAVFQEEQRLIAHYRAAGVPLVNITRGGDYHNGPLNRSRSWRRRLS